MNCTILFKDDFVDDQNVRLCGARMKHCGDTSSLSVGTQLTVGLLNGLLGHGRITSIDTDHLDLQVCLDREPPPPLPLTLIVALPRPKSMRKIVHAATTMGVKKIYLIKTWHVDKSYWQTPWLDAAYLHDLLIAGLEQAVDTVLPTIEFRKQFKPFIEDECQGLIAGLSAYVGHPGATMPVPHGVMGRSALAIGPEGGFTAYEIEQYTNIGFMPVSLGPRMLRADEAVPVLLGRLSE